MKQLTKQQAIDLGEAIFWEEMTFEERAEFQINQRLICMPFDIFHEAVEKTLGRSVFTHEFGLNLEGLKKELIGERPAPSFEDIINLIPENKRFIILTKE